MGKFDGVLLCTDCDGTLTDSDIKISDKNAKAIRYFQSEGGRFTLATGRFPKHAYNFEDKLKVNAPVIALNGVLVYDLDTDSVINYAPMETKAAFQVMDYLNREWRGVWEYWLNFNGSESACYKPMEDKFESETLKCKLYVPKECEKILTAHSADEKEVFKYIQSQVPDKIAKIVFVMPEDMTRPVQKDLREKFGNEFNFDSSWPNGLEMQWVQSGKGKAVEILKEYLGNITKTVCVGDYDNDISMLKVADIGYAVDNAIEQVKLVADRITTSNNDSAIAAIIEDLEAELK